MLIIYVGVNIEKSCNRINKCETVTLISTSCDLRSVQRKPQTFAPLIDDSVSQFIMSSFSFSSFNKGSIAVVVVVVVVVVGGGGGGALLDCCNCSIHWMRRPSDVLFFKFQTIPKRTTTASRRGIITSLGRGTIFNFLNLNVKI